MHLYATGQDSLPFLTRIQEVHPGDFWVNARLGALAGHRGNYAEGIRYFQSALAVRPDSSMCENYLGVFLLDSGHREEAVHHLRRAVALKPTDASCAFNLAAALRELGRYDEAIDLIRSALRRCGDAPLLHAALGDQMESKGRPVEAVAEYREAVRREPTLYLAHHRLRTLLMRQGRLEEARAAWQAALATNPPDHDDWYGYAEFCLYLGQEDEYRRARRALLARFGGSTEPMIAERTARACLLLPDSGDELRDVVALGERAWTADRKAYGPTFPFFLFLQGLAEYRQGRFDRAMELMQGDASRVLGPAPRLVLAMAQHRRGKMAEARETLAAAVAGHDWRASEVHDQDDWICHALRREAERLIDPDLPAFLRGDH
jgi:serine/threonine-protein kinase